MRIAQVLAGISLAEADVLRKAVGKKDAELIKKELGKFEQKAVGKGHDAKIIKEIAAQINEAEHELVAAAVDRQPSPIAPGPGAAVQRLLLRPVVH